MKKWLIRILIALSTLVFLAIGAFVIWAQFDYAPTKEAMSYSPAPEGNDLIFGKGD